MKQDVQVDVLAVDDHPDTLDILKKLLENEGLNCHTVSNGSQALEMIELGIIPGAILLDIMMPGLSGYAVCKTLRKTFSPMELPIIMLTGKTEVDALAKAYQSGANDYICKPFSREELIARVNCHLDLQKANKTYWKNLKLEKELILQKQKRAQAMLAAQNQEREKLRYQINPHFLFNSLASIRGAVFSNQKAAHEMITHLAEFCRLSLSRGAKPVHTIAREIEVTDHYLTMEKMRFGDYLSVDICVDPTVKKIVVPSLILQPLLENAIKYGTKTSPEHLDINIIVQPLAGRKISITITNTGRWVSDDTMGEKGSTGIGIKNIKARLTAFYNDQYLFEHREKDGQVNTCICLPDHLL